MKSLFLLCLLTLAVGSDSTVLRASRSNLNMGYVVPGDRLLYSQYFYQPPRPNAVQYQDVIYKGNATTIITSIQATEIGASQYASAYLLSGGVGARNATLRLQSALGWGYYYSVQVWGRWYPRRA